MGEVDEAFTHFCRVTQVDSKHERALFNAALCGQELKQFHKAKELYRKLLSVNPQHIKGRGNLAILLDREGELEEAHSQYSKAVGLEKGKRAAPLLNNMGICSLKLGRSAEAVRHYKAAMQKDPDYSLAHFNCGLAYAEMDKVGDATSQFETCLKKDGDMAFATLALADLAEMKGQPDRALALYQSLQKKFGDKDIEGLEIKVKGLARQLSKSLLDHAFQKFQERRQKEREKTVKEESSEKKEAGSKQSEVVSKQSEELKEELKEDKKMLQKIEREISSIRPESQPKEPSRVALESSQTGEESEQQESYVYWTLEKSKAVQNDPNESEERRSQALFRMGQIHLVQGEFERARECLEELQKKDEQFRAAEVLESLGDLVFKFDKEWLRAFDFYSKALQVNEMDGGKGRNPTGLLIKQGKCYEKLKNFKAAVTYYKAAVEREPHTSFAHFRLGWAYVRQGQREAGISHLRRSAELEPTNAEVLARLGEILTKEGGSSQVFEPLGEEAGAGGEGDEGKPAESLEEGVKLLRRALELDSTLSDAQVALGRALQKKGHTEEAVELYKKASEADPPVANAFYYLGVVLEKSREHRRSQALFKQCLNLDQQHFGASVHLATVLANQNEMQKAAKYFRHALKIDPKSVTAHFGLAKILHSLADNLDTALQHYDFVLAQQPGHYKALCQVGMLWLEKGELERAADALKKCLKLSPKYVLGLVSMGNLLFETGHSKNAAKYHQQALKFNPHEVQALIGLGNALYDLNRPTEAIQYYREALEQDDALADVHYNLGNALYLVQDTEGAISHYKRAIHLNPQKPESYYNLGNALCIKSEFQKAIDCYRDAIALDKLNAPAFYNLGNAHYMLNQFPEAIAAYQAALKLNPDSAECHFNIASAYNDQGDAEKAISHFKESLEYDSSNPETHMNLALLLYARKEYGPALLSFEECLRLNPALQGKVKEAMVICQKHLGQNKEEEGSLQS